MSFVQIGGYGGFGGLFQLSARLHDGDLDAGSAENTSQGCA